MKIKNSTVRATENLRSRWSNDGKAGAPCPKHSKNTTYAGIIRIRFKGSRNRRISAVRPIRLGDSTPDFSCTSSASQPAWSCLLLYAKLRCLSRGSAYLFENFRFSHSPLLRVFIKNPRFTVKSTVAQPCHNRVTTAKQASPNGYSITDSSQKLPCSPLQNLPSSVASRQPPLRGEPWGRGNPGNPEASKSRSEVQTADSRSLRRRRRKDVGAEREGVDNHKNRRHRCFDAGRRLFIIRMFKIVHSTDIHK